MNENEIKFYSHLGKLSTSFSKLEYLIREITGLHIVKDSYEGMVYLSIIGRNSLEKNTSLLKELTHIRSFGDKQQKLLKLIGDVNNIRKVRNLFIHGLWETPTFEDGELIIICNDKSFQLKKELNEFSQKLSYRTNSAQKFNLTTIQKHIKQLDKINRNLDIVLKEIIKDPREYFD